MASTQNRLTGTGPVGIGRTGAGAICLTVALTSILAVGVMTLRLADAALSKRTYMFLPLLSCLPAFPSFSSPSPTVLPPCLVPTPYALLRFVCNWSLMPSFRFRYSAPFASNERSHNATCSDPTPPSNLLPLPARVPAKRPDLSVSLLPSQTAGSAILSFGYLLRLIRSGRWQNQGRRREPEAQVPAEQDFVHPRHFRSHPIVLRF